jgi:hypothetical protein
MGVFKYFYLHLVCKELDLIRGRSCTRGVFYRPITAVLYFQQTFNDKHAAQARQSAEPSFKDEMFFEHSQVNLQPINWKLEESLKTTLYTCTWRIKPADATYHSYSMVTAAAALANSIIKRLK